MKFINAQAGTEAHPSRTLRSILLAAATVLTAVACSGSGTSEDSGKPPEELNVLRLPLTAPPLCADSVGGWFHKGASGGPEEIALQFEEEGGGCGGGETEDFLRLRLDRNSLASMPDGSPIEVGDSVFISVKWVGSDSVLFELKPSGLKFASNAKARLKIEYDKCGGDLNNDGEDDEHDDDIRQQLGIWRQEMLGEHFFLIGTGTIEGEDKIEADLTGFSRFMIAY